VEEVKGIERYIQEQYDDVMEPDLRIPRTKTRRRKFSHFPPFQLSSTFPTLSLIVLPNWPPPPPTPPPPPQCKIYFPEVE